MNKKAQFSARNYVIGLILMSAVIGLAFIMIQSSAINYDQGQIIDDSFRTKYDKFENNTKLANDLFNATSNKEGLNILGTGDILLKSTFSAITLVFNSLKDLQKQISYIGSDFGIPSQVTNIIMIVFLSIITMLIVFVVINSINKLEKL